MNLIIDPLLFWLPDNANQQDVDSALAFVDQTILIGRNGYSLVSSDPLWKKIVTQNYRKLSNFVRSPELLARLRELERHVRMVDWVAQSTDTAGIRELINFGNVMDPVEWMTAVTQVIAHSINAGESCCLLARLMLGRNLFEHRSMDHCRLYEKTHWKVYLKLQDRGAQSEHAITCISSLRNLLVPWTVRHDDELPDTSPRSGLAFIPKQNWADASVSVIRTVNSKTCWIDAAGNAWADTNTPGHAYHWDVFPSSKAEIDRLGNHVNITRYGAIDRGRAPGEVHH